MAEKKNSNDNMEKRIDDFSYRDIIKKSLMNKFGHFSFISEEDIEEELVKADKIIDFTAVVLNTNRAIMNELNKTIPDFVGIFKKIKENLAIICKYEYEVPFVSYVYEINLLNSLQNRISSKKENRIDIIYDIAEVNSRFNESELAHYMAIDNVFYFKVAEHCRHDEETKNVNTLIDIKGNMNTHIYMIINRVIRKYYDMYLSDVETDEIIKKVFLSYYGDVSMIDHIIRTVKREAAIAFDDDYKENIITQGDIISNHELIGKIADMNSVINSNDPLFNEFNRLKFKELLSLEEIMEKMSIDENLAMDYYIIALNEICNLVKTDKTTNKKPFII